MDAEHFDGAKIVTGAAAEYHSAVVTEDGALYTWGIASSTDTSNPTKRMPTGLGHADMVIKRLPTRVDPHHMQGNRVGRCHSLTPQFALAFAMGTHARLGSAQDAEHVKGSETSRHLQDKAAGADRSKGCAYLMMPEDLVKQLVEASRWQPAGVGEGVLRLMGRGKMSVEVSGGSGESNDCCPCIVVD